MRGPSGRSARRSSSVTASLPRSSRTIVIIAPHWRDLELPSLGAGEPQAAARDRRRVPRAVVGSARDRRLPCRPARLRPPGRRQRGVAVRPARRGPPAADSADQSRAGRRAAAGRLAARHRADCRRGRHRSLVESPPLAPGPPASFVRGAAGAGGGADGARARRPRALAQVPGLRSGQHAVEGRDRRGRPRRHQGRSRLARGRGLRGPAALHPRSEGPRDRPGGLFEEQSRRTCAGAVSRASAAWCCALERLRRVHGELGRQGREPPPDRGRDRRRSRQPRRSSTTTRSSAPGSASQLPQVAVPELGASVFTYRPRPRSRAVFPPRSAWSSEDRLRADGYRREQERASERESAGSLDDFLAGLHMRGKCEPVSEREHRARHAAHEQDQPVQPDDEAAHAGRSPAPRRQRRGLDGRLQPPGSLRRLRDYRPAVLRARGGARLLGHRHVAHELPGASPGRREVHARFA